MATHASIWRTHFRSPARRTKIPESSRETPDIQPWTLCGPDLALRLDVTRRIRLVHVAFVVAALGTTPALAQRPVGIVSGTVSLPGPDGQSAAIAGVTFTLTCPGTEPRTDVSDDQGQFRFTDVPAGTRGVTAELHGLRPTTKTVVVKAADTTDVALLLDLELLHVEINVTANGTALDTNPIPAHVETVTRGRCRQRR